MEEEKLFKKEDPSVPNENLLMNRAEKNLKPNSPFQNFQTLFQDKLDELAGQEGQVIAPHEKIIINPQEEKPRYLFFEATHIWSDSDGHDDKSADKEDCDGDKSAEQEDCGGDGSANKEELN